MTSTRTRAQLGAYSRRKGADAEMQLAKYLTTMGWPEARRAVATGWRTPGRENPDPGDITGTPGLVWQVKYVADMSDLQIQDAMNEAEGQAISSGADFGFLVQRRAGKSSPGDWWVWLSASELAVLVTSQVLTWAHVSNDQQPVRMLVKDLVPLLTRNAYGNHVSLDD